METIAKDAVIIGGGPAGLAAAVNLRRLGISDIVILEREQKLGGVLRQCIHDGFGLTRFKQALSGPEYAARFIDQVDGLGIDYITNATVLSINHKKQIVAAYKEGLLQYQAKSLILAMGCRERTRGAISIPGHRPSGVYTAGTAQAYMNLKNIMPGKTAVILGSGDIGLIMARRMTLEGIKVVAVFEILPYPSGLPRNIEQCLHDYDIPLLLGHTITDIKGQNRLKSVTVCQVNKQMQPISETAQDYQCDTLILSVGLIPENELTLMAGVELDLRTKGAVVDENYQTSVPGIFAAGNVLHVHDLVDFVSLEAESMAKAAAMYLNAQKDFADRSIRIRTDRNLSYTVPQIIGGNQDFRLSLRVREPMQNCYIKILQNDTIIKNVYLSKAIPAEMIQIDVKHKYIHSSEDIRVVIEHA